MEDILSVPFSLLRQGKMAELLEALDRLPPLSPAQAGRVLAWRALALEKLGRLGEAREAVLQAIRAAKEAGEQAAVPSLREVHARISAGLAALEHARQLAAQDQRLTEQPLEALFAEDPEQVVRQAGAFLEQGNPQSARAAMGWLLAQPLSPRPAVLARLTLARIDAAENNMQDCENNILSAWKIADHADDHGLITACARAAKMVGVQIPTPEF